MADTSHRLQLPKEDPLRKDYVLPECGVPVLGAGTDGFVVRAIARRSGYSDALKFIRDSTSASEREIQALQAIGRHSHVVELLKVYAPCGVRTSLVLAFPELNGTLADLARRSHRNRMLCYPLVGELAQQCLEGLAHVHQCRVVHRDLSPSNILVDIGPCANTGRPQFTVKIADFSRARVLPVQASVHTGMKQGPETYVMTTGLGTLRYSAPELLCHHRHGYGVGVDIWAFGAIWFEVLNSTEFMPGASDARRMASLMCRLGECPSQLFRGPHYKVIRPAAQKHMVDLEKEVLPLSSYKIPGQAGWAVLAAALQWSPSLRPSAAALAQKPWTEEIVADDGSPVQSSSLVKSVAAHDALQKVPVVQLPAPVASLAGAPPPVSAQLAPRASEQPSTQEGPGVPQPSPCADTGETSWQFCTNKPPTKLEVKGKCQCAGHCYTPGHRYWKGCNNKVVVRGSAYCLQCICVVATCLSPKLRGSLCSGHRNVLGQAPLAVRLVRAARPWLVSLIPCDVTDFLRRFSRLRGNVPLLVMSALLKEPRAVSGMLERLPNLDQVTAEGLQAALVGMLQSLQSEAHTKQSAAQKTSTKLTGKQRPRKTGPPTGKQGAPEETPRGRKRKAMAVAATHGNAEDQLTNDCSQLAKLIEVAHAHPWPRTVIKDAASFRLCVARVKVLDETMSNTCTAWGQDTVAYGYSFLRRKLILGELCSTPVSDRNVNWADVSLEDLKMCSPDQNQIMDTFPAKWSAEQVSLFCFDRSDWAIFAPLFGCLFGEVIEKVEADPDTLVKLVESEAFGEAAKAHHEQYGIASHPYALVKGFGKPESWPVTQC